MNIHKLGCPLIDEYNPHNLECICSQPSSVPVEEEKCVCPWSVEGRHLSTCCTKCYDVANGKPKIPSPSHHEASPKVEEWRELFNKKFFQDKTGERIGGWLAMDTTEIHNNNGLEGKWSKIAIPDDIESFISVLLLQKENEHKREYAEMCNTYYHKGKDEGDAEGYERGKKDYIDSHTKAQTAEELIEIMVNATLTERKRVTDILDGMKKPLSIYNAAKSEMWVSEVKCNQLIEEAKHLINNTQ